MTLNVNQYTDPGTIVGEVIVPAAITLATVPDVLGIVAYGNRSKRSINEAVKRGQVYSETLTVAGSPPYTATLIARGDRRVANTTITRTLNSEDVVLPDSAVSYPAATLLGSAAGTYDVSVNNAMGLKLDTGSYVTITFTSGAPGVVVTGSIIAVTTTLGGAGSTASRAEIAAGINAGLNAASALGYGGAYSAVATDATTGIRITSPLTSAYSDVQVLSPVAKDATTVLGFAATPVKAATLVQITVAYYNALATYKADYVATSTNLDPLTETATSITRVGSFAGVTSYAVTTDYVLNTGDIDWSPDVAATFTGSTSTATFDVNPNYNIVVAVDGKTAVAIRLDGLGSPPLGYTNPVDNNAATPTEIKNNINAVLSANAAYGPYYKSVASLSGNKIVLTSPNQGLSSSIEVSVPASLDATTAIFGLSAGQLPYTVLGTGSRPTVGALYFTTYNYDRPTDEYNTPKRFFSEDQMIQDLTPVSVDNRLALYGQIAFNNGAPSIVVSQVNDTTTAGSPTVNEVKAALDALALSDIVTDVVVSDTRLNSQVNLLNHVIDQSSPTQKNYRCGWFGMAIGTAIGDTDTADTFVYRAAVTLQVSSDSAGRGRLYLVAPTGVDRTITNEDGTESTITLDSTAAACAVAARHTSFSSPATSLAAKTIVGFDVDTFPTFLKGERAELAQNGVMVVTNSGGRLEILDPVSTERGGGALPQFMYRSAISQKDNVTRNITKSVDRNLRGVVPDDLSDFIFDIKIVVSTTIRSLISSGSIGPYRDSTGASRDIDLSRDVQAEQSSTDPTKFRFRYFFFLKYPALRFEGEFSVDNPFFA